MIVYIIEFILFIIGFMLVLSLFFNLEEDNNLACCIGTIPLLFLGYIYVSFNNNGRMLLITILYGLYFLIYFGRNPGKLDSIFGGILGLFGEIIGLIINAITYILGGFASLFSRNDNKDENEYGMKNYKMNTLNQNKTQKIKEKNKTPIKNNNTKKENKEESHYYNGLLDINRATKEELEKTEGITKVTAQKIITLRKKGRYITSFVGLTKLLGISYRELSYIMDNVYISEDIKNENKKETKPIKPIKQYPNKKQDNNKKPNNTNNNRNKKPTKIQDKKEKININKAQYNEINGIPGITSMMASKIIKLRTEGKYIQSYDDLKNKLKLSPFKLEQVKDYILITNEFQNLENNTQKNNNNKKEPVKEKQDKPDENNINNKNKIDINTASEKELAQIPGLTIIQAKKIIQLRQAGFYIKSFEDLSKKLNLNTSQIEVIKNEVIIKETPRKINRRRLDI